MADKHIIEPLEDFRKKQIGGVKENKKKFDKKTEKFCQSQERFLNMSTKKPENTIQEVSASDNINSNHIGVAVVIISIVSIHHQLIPHR